MSYSAKSILAKAFLAVVMAYSAHVAKGTYFPSDAAKKEVCGCGNLCPEKHIVFCQAPACSREHGHKATAVILGDWHDLNMALKKGASFAISFSKRPKHKPQLIANSASTR